MKTDPAGIPANVIFFNYVLSHPTVKGLLRADNSFLISLCLRAFVAKN